MSFLYPYFFGRGKDRSFNKDAAEAGLIMSVDFHGEKYLMTPLGVRYGEVAKECAEELGLYVGRSRDGRVVGNYSQKGNALEITGNAQRFLRELGGMELGTHAQLLAMEKQMGRKVDRPMVFSNAVDYGELSTGFEGRNSVSYHSFVNGVRAKAHSEAHFYEGFFEYDQSRQMFLDAEGREVLPSVLRGGDSESIRSPGPVSWWVRSKEDRASLSGERIPGLVQSVYPSGLRSMIRDFSGDEKQPRLNLTFGLEVGGESFGLFAVKKLEEE